MLNITIFEKIINKYTSLISVEKQILEISILTEANSTSLAKGRLNEYVYFHIFKSNNC